MADEFVVVCVNDASDRVIETVSAVVASRQDISSWSHICQLRPAYDVNIQ